MGEPRWKLETTSAAARGAVAVAGLLLLHLALPGCGPTVRRKAYAAAEPRVARPAGCEVDVYREAEEIHRPYVEIGEVSIGDSGLSVDCGRKRVLAELRQEVCRLGGDAALVTRWRSPDLISSCIRIKAVVFVYRETQSAGATE